MDKVKEVGRFSDKLNHSRLNQEEIEIMNNAITITEIEAVIKNLTKKKNKNKTKQDQMAAQENCVKHLEER